jgi:hypothetical protein
LIAFYSTKPIAAGSIEVELFTTRCPWLLDLNPRYKNARVFNAALAALTVISTLSPFCYFAFCFIKSNDSFRSNDFFP